MDAVSHAERVSNSRHMKIFVHDNKTEGRIADFCLAEGADILSPEIIRNSDPLDAHVFFLDTVDALILEMTKPNQETQFILAQALLAEKPLLCLYGKNQSPRHLLDYIQKKRVARIVKTYGYVERELSTLVADFVRRFDPDLHAEDEIPSVKFTMRISPRIERYVDWLAAESNTNRADVIRRLISSVERQDDTYKNIPQ